MAILVDENTRVLVQGITGSFGGRHAELSLDYGTQLVAGVTPGKGGQVFEHGDHKVPIFDTVEHILHSQSALTFLFYDWILVYRISILLIDSRGALVFFFFYS